MTAGFRRALAAAEFAELMRRSYWAQCGTVSAVVEFLGGDGDEELDWMLGAASPAFVEFCAR